MNITDPITIALTKGRILKETLPLLAKVGIEPSEDLDASRKLIVPHHPSQRAPRYFAGVGCPDLC